MGNIIDGKLVATSIKALLRDEVQDLKQKGINVCLAVILVGDDQASQVYVRNKKKACEELGIISKQYILSESCGQNKLLELIDSLNKDASVNGILCQLPLPSGYDEKAVLDAVSTIKDVDSFHSYNVGRLITGDAKFLPCTPAGVMELLSWYNIDVAGKECVIVGRSNIVGKPLSMLMLQANGTVTICHSKTKNLKEVCQRADILVTAIGKPKFFNKEYVKPGAVIIDVGINRDENNKLCGDVDFEAVEPIASYITPVPGGCGPLTVAMLMHNTLAAAMLQNKLIDSYRSLKIKE